MTRFGLLTVLILLRRVGFDSLLEELSAVALHCSHGFQNVSVPRHHGFARD